MDFNVRKRKREDSDVAATPMKKIKVCNITCSTEPCNKVQESVNMRKRRASDDGKMPRKKARPSEGSVENFMKQWGKREASVDAGTSAKRMRCSDSTSITVSSPTESSADVSISTGSSTTGSSATRSSSSSTGSSSSGSSEKVIISHIFNNASLEEQKVFELASSGSTSRAEFENKYVQQAPIG
ncbi:secreted 45 kDa protein-like isoform X2 [Thunnus thynnus]